MLNKRMILFINIPDEIKAVMKSSVENAIGEGFSIGMDSIETQFYCNCLQNEIYDYIFITDETIEKMKKVIEQVRSFDIRVKIILYVHDLVAYYELQKYDIYFCLRSTQLMEDCKNLNTLLKQIYQNKILYLKKGKLELLIHSIIYIESDKNYVNLYTLKGKIKNRGTMKELWNHYQEIRTFIPVSKSVLVNPFYIEKTDNEKLFLKNGSTVFISRNKRGSVYELLKTKDM